MYDIEFRPTGEHGNADGLFRLPLSTEAAVANPEDPSVFNMTQMKVLPVKAAQIMAATRSDAILSKVLYYLQHRWPDKVPKASRMYAFIFHQLCLHYYSKGYASF